MSGYSRTGSARYATTPATTTRMFITVAKTGRRMETSESSMVLSAMKSE